MGDTYLISSLTAKRAEVSGIIADLEKPIAQHRANLVHIDAVLRLCVPDVVAEEIAPKPSGNGTTGSSRGSWPAWFWMFSGSRRPP
jgi:hypothetical protein